MITCTQLFEYAELYWEGLVTMRVPHDVAWWFYFNCEVIV